MRILRSLQSRRRWLDLSTSSAWQARSSWRCKVAACAFFICFALAGYADQFGDFTYEEYDTTIEITDYPEYATGDVIIPSEIVGKPVTSIGERAFYRCSSLTGVTIPDSVTSIGEKAFYDCRGLTSVTIPDSVTSIGYGAFIACTSLTAIEVNAASPSYSSLGGVLFNKNQTSLIIFPAGKGGSYTIPNSATSIGQSAFYGCSSLTSVTIPDSVTSIEGGAFYECSNLTSVTIGNGVTSMGFFAFAYCSSLTSVTIPESVTSIGEAAFASCSSLTSVTIPDSVTSVGGEAFYYCTGLTSVTIGSGVTSTGDRAFSRCSSLTAITVSAANPAYNSVDGVFFNKNQTMLIRCPGGKVGSYAIPDSVISIEHAAFSSCTSLTSVTIPDSVTKIGDDAFFGCSSLRAIYFEGNAPSLGESVFWNTVATTYHLAGTTDWGTTYGDRPTAEISVLPDPLIIGTPVDGMEGWFLSDWWGEYKATYAPWLFHAEHGFIFRYPESTYGSLYFYDDAMGAWWWTSESTYPFLYAFDPPADNAGRDIEAEWLWYFEETKTPRSFGVVTGDHAGSFLYYDP